MKTPDRKKSDRPDLKTKVRWAAGATGVALAYFGAFALLMYPAFAAVGGA